MTFDGYDQKFWIKFSLIVLPLSIIMLIWSPSMKWKLINIFGVFVGAFLALSGKTINIHRRR